MIALLSIIGGLYFPVTLLPQLGCRPPRSCSPSPPATELLRHLLVGSPRRRSSPRDGAAQARAVRGRAPAALDLCPVDRDPCRASGAERSSSTEVTRDRARTTTTPPRSCLRARRLRVPQHVVYRSFPTETVVLNLQTGTLPRPQRDGGADARGARGLAYVARCGREVAATPTASTQSARRARPLRALPRPARSRPARGRCRHSNAERPLGGHTRRRARASRRATAAAAPRLVAEILGAYLRAHRALRRRRSTQRVARLRDRSPRPSAPRRCGR